MTDPRPPARREVTAAPGGLVTLVEETTFCRSTSTGDITSAGQHGLVYLDSRLLSGFELRVDDAPLEPLSVAVTAPFAATFVSRPSRPRRPDSRSAGDLLVLRRRYVGRGLREDVEIRNHSPEPVIAQVQLTVAVDFADLPAVQEGTVDPSRPAGGVVDGAKLGFRHATANRQVQIEPTGAPAITPDRITWAVSIPANAAWSASLQVTLRLGTDDIKPRFGIGQPVDRSTPMRRLEQWRASVPRLTTRRLALRLAFDAAVADLSALRLFDPAGAGWPVPTAGVPWFLTLFGRDALLTAYQSLLIGPDLALGVLQALAALQGRHHDAVSEEQPGRILHEVRHSAAGSTGLAAGRVYYGSADATPLFVLVLGECLRWGVPYAQLAPLVSHADRALAWVETDGDADGDGFVDYQRTSPDGLVNQGWKDSADAVRYADGRLAEPPIALCEVQGYVYAAYRARAALARVAGDLDTARRCTDRARRLKDRFNQAFWLSDRGYFALALDGRHQPVDALTSNMGHCLWTGIVDADKAPAVASHLLSPELFSGWGLRTLATSMSGYHPGSYHNGSVWPHDTAVGAAGLMRYEFVAEASQVIAGMLAAAEAMGGRLPELFSGLSRADVSTPVSYPAACSPQAWSAAAPLQLLRTLLRLEPDLPANRLRLDPLWPAGGGPLTLDGVPLGDGRLRMHVDGDRLTVSGVPAGVTVNKPAEWRPDRRRAPQ